MSEVMIPPWVMPVTPETWSLIDDATQAFTPQFGRGQTQVGIWADPRWGLKRKYQGMRAEELAAILHVLNERRGQANVVRATVHKPLRGSALTSCPELLANNTFANGTTGWGATGAGAGAIAVTDRVLRVPFAAYGAGGVIATATGVLNAPYAGRAFFRVGRNTLGVSYNGFFDDNGVANSTNPSTAGGLTTGAFVAGSTTLRAVPQVSNGVAGDYFEIPYVSLARCLLVDNGPNSILHSDNIDSVNAPGNAVWSGTGLSTVTANATAAPDGTSTAERLIENSSNSGHRITQNVTVSSSVSDCVFAVAIKADARSFVELALVEGTGSTAVAQYFNLTTAAVGATGSTGANWSNRRAFAVNLGNGWVYCCIVARKTNAATTVTAQVAIASADGTDSYTGGGAGGLYAWRATFVGNTSAIASASSVPTRLVQTAAAATGGTTQPGSALYVKGGPASTTGFLKTGDFFEWQGELKMATAPLDFDAAGLGYLQFRPGLAGSPADNDPIIVCNPFGRFMCATAAQEFENQFGIYGEADLEMVERYS